MRRDLPPLTALIAFEAAARNMNFTRAAEELNVTQPAVSHQIQMLEADLGVKLFKRSGRQISLTETGQIYSRTVMEALSRIADSTLAIRSATDQGAVTIATNPGVAAFWLMPRLETFQSLHPELQVRVLTSERDRNLPLKDLDIAIRFGSGSWEDAVSEILMPEEVIPVCSPSYGEGVEEWTPARIWNDQRRLHQEDDEARWYTWEDWRQVWVPDQPPGTPRIVFSNYSVKIMQVVGGRGIGLGWTHMLRDLLDSGALVPAGNFPISSERGYFVVVPSGKPVRPEVGALRDWLFEQVPPAIRDT